MINPSTAVMLARYKAWAEQLTFDAVAALPPAELVRQRPTLFKSMIGSFNHSAKPPTADLCVYLCTCAPRQVDRGRGAHDPS